MPHGISQRLLKLFGDEKVKATFFVPGLEAERHPALIREIRSEGHETAANGYHLEDHSKLGDRELDTLKRAHAALSDCTGEAPVGWRAPEGMLSADTLGHLASLGYLYDSSFQDDDFPYPLDADGGNGMIEIPQNQTLIDQTLFSIKMPDVRVYKNWVEEYDGLNREGCFACLTLHPRQDYGVGRAPRMLMLGDFIRHTRSGPRPASFKTCREVAEMARGAH